MSQHTVNTEHQREQVLERLREVKLPASVRIEHVSARTAEQNKLQRLRLNELADQGDMTAEEFRGYCKLNFGVPILFHADDNFRESWNSRVKPVAAAMVGQKIGGRRIETQYESMLLLMQIPHDMPVTRLMTVRQKTRYLDDMYNHFTGQGYYLTEPKASK